MPEPVRRTPPARMPAAPAATSSAGGGSVAPPSQHTHVPAHAPAHVPANHQTNVQTHGTGHVPANHQTNVQAHVPTNAQTPGTTNIQASQQAHVQTNVPANHQTNVQVHVPTNVQTHVPHNVQAHVPSSVRGPVSAPSPVPMTVSQPSVAMTVSQPSVVATSQPAPMTVDSEPVMRRAPPPEQQQQQQQQPPVDEWARYHAQQMDHSGHHGQQMDVDQLAAVAAAQAGVYATGGQQHQHQQHQQQHQQQQHGVSASANGDQDENDSSNRNSMGFQITSITQSSAEPDAEPIDESGDEDVSDVAESARLSAGGGGGSIGSGGGGGVSAVDGLPGRLQLPLGGTPPSAALTPRELTASPGVTSSEVLPVIPTIDGFGITLVPGALESVDAHGNAEIVEFPSEIEMDLMPTGLTVGVAPGSPGDDLQETWQSRFKVVKIETNVPFKRGRWQCMDYMDQPEASGGTAEVTASAGSSAHSSVHAGELEQPQPAASEEASLPGLQDEPAGGVRWEPRIDAATPDPAAAAAGAGAAGPQPSLSVPHQAHAGTPHPGGGGGLLHSRDAAAAASAPNVHSAATERGASLALGIQPGAAAGLARQSSQPATPEEARLAADGVPVFRSAPPEDGTLSPSAGGGPGGLTLPDLLPNSSLLELVQASVTDEQEGTADSTSPGSSGTVEKTEPIDNKIEQAMDLVKSHLLLAVREEVDVLKANISKLVDKISVLERENEVLKSNASPQVLAQLESAPSLAPSPPPPVSMVVSVAAVSAPVSVPVMSAPAPAAAPAVLPAQVAVPAPQQQQMQQMQVQPPPGVGPAP